MSVTYGKETQHFLPSLITGKCLVRPIANGSVADPHVSAGQNVPHGSRVKYRCSRGHVLSTTIQPECYNGTWVLNGTWDKRPTCEPGTIYKGLGFDSQTKFDCGIM